MLIEKYLPRFDVRARHTARINAAPQRTYAALRSIDLGRSPLIRCLFWMRTIPSRHRRAARTDMPHYRTFLESALAQGWVLLEEIPGRELVMGTVTQPWRPVVKFVPIPATEFCGFAEPGFAKITWSIRVDEHAGSSLVTLETRVLTTDAMSHRHFRRYWLIFSPFIKLIRRLILGLLKRELRRDEALRTA